MNFSKTDLYLAALARAGVMGIDQYRKKLEDNAPVPMNVEDLYCEARVALIFAAYRWSVTMRPESNTPEPDLEARLNDGALLYIEVKHFRGKKQDHLPEPNLLPDETLPQLPAIPLDEKEPPWEQMCERAVKAAPKYKRGESNLIAFVATTEQLNGELDAAAACYDEKIGPPPKSKTDLQSLSAMMLVDSLCTPNRQNVWSAPILRARRVRSSSVISALQEIKWESGPIGYPRG